MPRTVTRVSLRYPQLLCVLACVAGVLGSLTLPAQRGDKAARSAAPGDSSIQNHGTDCAFRGEEALSGAVASCAQLIMGIVMGGLFDNRGDGAGRVLALR
jgi:hypothetical protein